MEEKCLYKSFVGFINGVTGTLNGAQLLHAIFLQAFLVVESGSFISFASLKNLKKNEFLRFWVKNPARRGQN